jgi:phosphohistidine phosphatase SixA
MDTPLNEEGEAQAMVTARYLRSTGVRFDEAWSSDLSRARKVGPSTERTSRCGKLTIPGSVDRGGHHERASEPS